MSSSTTISPVSKPSGQDDLDRLLLTYFQGELPRHWPSAPTVDEVTPSTVASERAPFRFGSGSLSRGVLAASIALLLGFCWYIGSGTSSNIAPVVDQKKSSDLATAGSSPILDELTRIKATPTP